MDQAATKYTRTYAHKLAVAMVSRARKRARKRGLPFDLSAADLTIPTLCPVLGIPIKLEPGPHCEQSASLDRIVPELGYVRGNVAVISSRANALKSNASPAELAALLGYVDANAHARAPIVSAPAVPPIAPVRVCAECGRRVRQTQYPGDKASPLCRSCAMRLAWSTDEYRAAIASTRAKHRKRCAFCGTDGVSYRARYHPECWRKYAESLK
jgi:hypothetical protein